jgi:hypothetical protein
MQYLVFACIFSLFLAVAYILVYKPLKRSKEDNAFMLQVVIIPWMEEVVIIPWREEVVAIP